jgi:hypothetical protein
MVMMTRRALSLGRACGSSGLYSSTVVSVFFVFGPFLGRVFFPSPGIDPDSERKRASSLSGRFLLLGVVAQWKSD